MILYKHKEGNLKDLIFDLFCILPVPTLVHMVETSFFHFPLSFVAASFCFMVLTSIVLPSLLRILLQVSLGHSFPQLSWYPHDSFMVESVLASGVHAPKISKHFLLILVGTSS